MHPSSDMRPYQQITFIRNRIRARDLRLFRERVQDYFDQLDQEEDTRATRAESNRMLPRVLEIVEAADLSGPFADMREWQSRLFADNADQLTDMAERIDFLERVLAQQRPVPQLKPGEKKQATPQ